MSGLTLLSRWLSKPFVNFVFEVAYFKKKLGFFFINMFLLLINLIPAFELPSLSVKKNGRPWQFFYYWKRRFEASEANTQSEIFRIHERIKSGRSRVQEPLKHDDSSRVWPQINTRRNDKQTKNRREALILLLLFYPLNIMLRTLFIVSKII